MERSIRLELWGKRAGLDQPTPAVEALRLANNPEDVQRYLEALQAGAWESSEELRDRPSSSSILEAPILDVQRGLDVSPNEYFTPRAIVRLISRETEETDRPLFSMLERAAYWLSEQEALVDLYPDVDDDVDGYGLRLNDAVHELFSPGLTQGADVSHERRPEIRVPGLLSDEGQRYARNAGLKFARRQAEVSALTRGLEPQPSLIEERGYFGPFCPGLERLLRFHVRWVHQQALRAARALLRRTLRQLRGTRPRPPVKAAAQPRTWVCVCGTERLAAPVVPRAPQMAPLPTDSQQGRPMAFALAA
ncbi:hypothetical protein ACIOJE_07200 [Kitasatospora sp. NPDC087861]|uniref:hypothetical protein n=1 Tax=Kitasatospora sp. NPDC087861 TaxID=3364070 RepID=UPI0038215F82